MSNFQFLAKPYPYLTQLLQLAEQYMYSDPPSALVKLRIFGEQLCEQLLEEQGLPLYEDDSFHSMLFRLKDEGLLTENLKDHLFKIKKLGNLAAHEHIGSERDVSTALFSAFKVAKWLIITYYQVDLKSLRFSRPKKVEQKSQAEDIARVEEELKQLKEEAAQLRAKLSTEEKEEIRLRAFEADKAIELTEEETREIIDLALHQQGWEVNTQSIRYAKGSRPEKNKNKAIAEWPLPGGKADYALFIGLQLVGFIEAKRSSTDVPAVLNQAKRYGRELVEKEGFSLLGPWGDYKVPFLFATNGRAYSPNLKEKSGIWFWDSRNPWEPARALSDWLSPKDLSQKLSQDIAAAQEKLKAEPLDLLRDKQTGLGLREYQIQAIQAVEAHLNNGDHQQRALLAMATGTGKTRTILGLCYRLLKSGRFKRILFLVDRQSLGDQAYQSFDETKIEQQLSLTECFPTLSLSDRLPELSTQLHFATVQGMLRRIESDEDGQHKQLSPASYDCIIVDEAHRGYNQHQELSEEELLFKSEKDYLSKYQMVLDYFDAFRIGLTATPALHTSQIFGPPIFRYTYEEAVIAGYLVDHEPPYQMMTKLGQNGMQWEKGDAAKFYDKPSRTIIEIDALEDEVDIDLRGFNRQAITESFNQTIVHELIQKGHIDPYEGGKTLVFAVDNAHADLLVRLFKEELAKEGLLDSDDMVQKITGSIDKPKEAIRRFKNEEWPKIVVTVDLLTTGIDVPKIDKLLFLRPVKSRILYEQMLGRATRLCPEINKQSFKIFDAVQLYSQLSEMSQMRPLVQKPQESIEKLVNQLPQIPNEEQLINELQQITAKIQRKRQLLNEEQERELNYFLGEEQLQQFLDKWQSKSPKAKADFLFSSKGKQFVNYMDQLKASPKQQIISEHQDEYRYTQRGYGEGNEKPEDYLNSFKQYVEEHRNKILALDLLYTSPKDLKKEDLKTLELALRKANFSVAGLRSAWKASKAEETTADLIAFIRTLALGKELDTPAQRAKRVIDKIKGLKDWTKGQIRWLNNIEKRLAAEKFFKAEELNEPPFNQEGGYKRFKAQFKEDGETVLQMIQEHLFDEPA